MGRLTFAGLLGRFAASLLLVVVTYNPTGLSYLSWLSAYFPHVQPLQAIVGLVLLGLWMFFVHATWRSLGAIGVVLGLAICAAIGWLLSSWGWLTLSNHFALVWLVLGVVATVGLCWGLIRVRVSGQPVIEEVKG
jgi:hypothetical protein